MVPCYGDCGPDPAWEAEQARKRAKADREADTNKRRAGVLTRMLEKGLPDNEAARVQRIVDLEVDLERLKEEHEAVLAALKRIGKGARALSTLCDKAASAARELVRAIEDVRS